MRFWRRQCSSRVTEGSVFERIHPTNLVERAEVVWVGDDASGIQHVRFFMSYVRPDGDEPQGTRILSAQSFMERYGETQAAAG